MRGIVGHVFNIPPSLSNVLIPLPQQLNAMVADGIEKVCGAFRDRLITPSLTGQPGAETQQGLGIPLCRNSIAGTPAALPFYFLHRLD